MSVLYCDYCDKHIDTDYDVEHLPDHEPKCPFIGMCEVQADEFASESGDLQPCDC